MSEYDFFGNVDEASAKKLLHNGDVVLTDADSVTKYGIANTDELTDALLADLLNSSYEDRYKSGEKPIGIITFCDLSSTEISATYADTEEVFYTNTIYGALSYYLYESMTNTVNYLKSSGDYDLLSGDNLFEEHSVNKAYAVKCSDYRELSSIVPSRYMSYIFCQSVSFEEEDEAYDNALSTNSEIVELFKENGTKVTDADELKTLDEKSWIYRYASSDDYIVLFIGENGGRYIRLITDEEAP
ncbi:MAG: hypothetical protein LUG95_02825 [Clostridiales bacterium]|nr:hypothetical protein [Clostridiales bacterium]